MKLEIEWVNIESLPLKKASYLVTDGIKVEKARWHPRIKEWMFPNARLRITPTHWMPLPLPPKTKTDETA